MGPIYYLNGGVKVGIGKNGSVCGGEIQLTDAIAELFREEQVLTYEFDGIRYDCGSKLGYLKANLEFGLMHPELGPEFRKCIEQVSERLTSGKGDVSTA